VTAERKFNYAPLDHVLELPGIRILRALRHFDAISTTDLWEVLNIPDEQRDSAYIAALGLAHERGHVERLDYSRGPRLFGLDNCNWYRITKAGRATLARRLTDDLDAMNRDHRRGRKRAA
jgi:hypothetical protein